MTAVSANFVLPADEAPAAPVTFIADDKALPPRSFCRRVRVGRYFQLGRHAAKAALVASLAG